MKIGIKFLGVIDDIDIFIYDNDILIYSGQTSYGYTSVILRPNRMYKLKAFMPCEGMETYFCVNHIGVYYFIFPSLYVYNNSVTFFLTDAFYPNLPIERGEITLWQK